jgi:GTPase SAR1 family protein
MLPVIAAEYKLVLVGDSSVGTPRSIKGKSSLLSRFVDGKFD